MFTVLKQESNFIFENYFQYFFLISSQQSTRKKLSINIRKELSIALETLQNNYQPPLTNYPKTDGNISICMVYIARLYI